MKKFTRNFLSGGQGSYLHVFRSVALGLVALLWAHTSAFSQCTAPTGPVNFTAGDDVGCFMDDDSVYTVEISAANFYNVDSINLFLDYNETDFVFDGFVILEDMFNQTTNGNSPLSISDDGDELNISWTEWDSRGRLDNSGANIPFLKVMFRATGSPAAYTNDLEWMSSSKVWYCGGFEPDGVTPAPYIEFGDDAGEVVNYYDGEISTTVAYTTIEYTVDPETPTCANTPVDITVTDPVGDDMLYSFNGNTYSENPTANAFAGNNTVQVMNSATGCVSVIQPIVIDAPDALEWSVEISDESCDRQGEIQFTIETASTAPYTYWVVPEFDINFVLNTILLEGEDSEKLDDYNTGSNQVLRPNGYYYIAVQDANGCVNLVDGWMNSVIGVWDYVYIDNSSVVDADVDVTVDEVTCAGGSDGEITINSISGGQPSTSSEYDVLVTMGGVTIFDGLVGTSGIVWSGLKPGDYLIAISDTVNCTYTETVTIDDVKPWTFDVAYKDAPCADATAELWVSEVLDGEGDPVDMTGSTVVFHVVGGTVDMPIDTMILVTDTLKGIPAANYSAWIQDTLMGCGIVAYDNDDNSGNTIPILDDGSITFNTVVTDETCFGEADGTVGVTDVTRSCENCNEGAYYEYMVMDTAEVPVFTTDWMPIDSVLDVLSPNEYWVVVRDSTKTDSVCASYEKINVMGADSALQMVVDSAYAPTCNLGNDGYVKMHVTGGTAPYEYSVDNAPNWRDEPSFGLTEGEHLLQVRDANMCIIDTIITVDSIDAIIITASIDTIVCPGDGAEVDVAFTSMGRFADEYDYTYYYAAIEDDVFTGTTFVPAWDTTATPTELAPGTYFVGAKDPYGCISNVIELELKPVEEMEVVVTSEDAVCYGTWSGQVNLEVTSGTPDSVFMYAFANNPEVLVPGNDSILNWRAFDVDSITESIEMQKGNYYFVVKGSCDQYSAVEFIEVMGYDKIMVNEIDSVTPVMCYGGADGTIVVQADDVKGGSPEAGEGIYLYSLYDADGDLVGDAMQESNVFDELEGGMYMLYVYDNTDEDAMPPMCPPDSVAVNVPEFPELLIDSIHTYDVNCAEANNGEIHVFISGGLGGVSGLDGATSEDEPDGNAYTVTVNSITGDQDYSLELGDLIDTVVFQTQGGMFEIVVNDANGCEAIDTVMIYEPTEWAIKTIITEPSDCGENDGVIKGIITGGYAGVPVEVTVDDSIFVGGPYYAGDTVTLVDSAIYSVEYVVSLVNDSTSVADSMIMPVIEQCAFVETYVIDIINPFEFIAETECTKCYGESNGTIKITEITGGSGEYQFQIVDATLDNYDPLDEAAWWPKDEDGDNVYVTDSVIFDTIPGGEYKIYLRDDEGFTLAKCCRPIRAMVCEADSLELVSVKLVNGVNCEGDSTGAISIHGTGGTEPYLYAYTRTELGDNGYPYVGLPNPDSLTWYDNDTISNLPVGTYIGWIWDANGCLTGCEINSEGLPIDEHRVVIMDEGSVAIDSIYVDEPMCYGGEATLELWGVTAGTSAEYLTFMLEGITYMGDTVSYVFDSMDASKSMFELEGVLAPMDTVPYKLTLKTDLNCEAAGTDVSFDQPEVYMVNMDNVGEGICVGQSQAVILLSTEGGTAPFTYDIYADGAEYAMGSTNVNHVVPIGPKYHVVSTDALGCEAVDTLDLQTPLDVTFEVQNVTCFADVKASAKVTAVGTPGRMFKVLWDELEGDVVISSGESDEFEKEIVISEMFEYDDTNLDDVHYVFTVVDEEGCEAGADTITFDKVDGPLQVVNVEEVEGECEATISFEIAGGTAPYQVKVDSVIVADSIGFFEVITIELKGGEHVIEVLDNHTCFLLDTITTSFGVARDTMVSYWEGEEGVMFSDVEAGVVDTTLMEGLHTFSYNEGCAILNVDVVEIAAPVLDSVTPTDSIETNHPVFTIVFVDDVELGEMGYLTVTPEDSTEAALEIEVTADMLVGNTLTVDYDGSVLGYLAHNTTYTVAVDSGVVRAWDGTTWMFTTGDSVMTSIPVGPEADLDFKVYPNPFNNYIKVDNYDKLSRVVITNIAGQRVLDIEYPSYEIRTGNLVTGVYVVTLIADDKIVKSERIIKR